MRILVVEDDKKIASFVAKGLREAGFAVDHADNGADGLERAQHQSYDAAVIDVMLPKLDGLSIIEHLRDRKSTRLNSSHLVISYAVFCLTQSPPHSTLFPYTTLFRSRRGR